MAQAYGNLALPILPSFPANTPTRLPVPLAANQIVAAVWPARVSGGAGPQPGPKPPPPGPVALPAVFDQRTTIHPWFDEVHVTPRRLDLGRVLATTNIPMTVHNAYRKDTWTWNSFVNNAGAGTELTGPTPPQILSPQESTLGLVLVVTTDGVPVVDTTLDFGFTNGSLIPVPIIFSRLVFFPFFPQEGFTEDLGFLTDVFESKDGTEKRASLRRFPRVTYDLRFREEDEELVAIQHFLLGRPGATYGIPLWHESTVLTSPVAADDIIMNVQDTRFRQFRNDGVGVIYDGRFVFDIFQIQSFTDTTITPVNPLVLDLPAGTRVLPVRLATTGPRQRGSRWPVSLGQVSFPFQVRDIEEDLSDVTGWPTYNGKLLIDDCNALGRDQVSENIAARLVVLDNDTGPRQQFSYPPNARYSSVKQWAPQGIEKLWNVRELVYALRGQQKSFYMPTNRNDLTPLEGLTAANDTLRVVYAGYNYVFGNGYRDHIRLTLADGSQITREVVDVGQNEAQTEETLMVDTDWVSTVPLADIVRIEFLQLVRFGSDRIRMRYEPGRPGARVEVPTISVLQ